MATRKKWARITKRCRNRRLRKANKEYKKDIFYFNDTGFLQYFFCTNQCWAAGNRLNGKSNKHRCNNSFVKCWRSYYSVGRYLLLSLNGICNPVHFNIGFAIHRKIILFLLILRFTQCSPGFFSHSTKLFYFPPCTSVFSVSPFFFHAKRKEDIRK